MSKKVLNLSKVFLTFAFVISMLACALTVNFASADNVPLMVDGGSIRYQTQGNAGIRFSAYVPDSLFDNTETKDLKDNVSVGMYLIPATNVGEGVTEIDGQTEGVKKVSPTVWAESDKAGYQQYNVVITGIPEANYATQILASSFIKVDEVEDVSSTVIRSIANVANTLLAMDSVAEEGDEMKLDANQVTELGDYISATDALGDVDVTILDGVAKWTAVENATSYIVKTEDGVVKTTATQYALNGESEISVLACGDGVNNTYSALDTAAVHALGELQLASFDDKSYFEDLSPSNPSFAATAYYPVSTFVKSPMATGLESPIFRTNRADVNSVSAAACVEIGVPLTVYQAGGARYAAFTVKLQKSLNLDDYAGIKVRMNVYGCWTGDTDPTIFNYYLVGQDNLNQGYKSGKEDGNVAWHQLSALNTWFDWYITADELASYYENGDSQMTFMVYYGGSKGTGTGNYGIGILLDDISYYNTLETPKNLAVADSTVTWSAVQGAEEYVVNIDGVDVAIVTETSYDLSAYASTGCTIKVKATSSTLIASEYSEECAYVVTDGLTIAAFDSAIYESSVKVLLDNTIQPWNGGAIDYTTVSPKIEYRTGVDGASDGDALLIQPVLASYVGGTARHAVFTVKLAKPLDLSGTYEGITIRFQPVDVANGLTSVVASDTDTIDRIQLCNPTTKDNTYKYYYNSASTDAAYNAYAYPYLEVVEGNWYEWTITLEQLKTLYSDGATELVFAMVSKGGASYNYANPAETYLDYIEYVGN
ncbi:MAG: hypothetical protein E7348_04385 [Clostridiales bacterium]|nr:hypothetical protein [Clostridiales bacterium]